MTRETRSPPGYGDAHCDVFMQNVPDDVSMRYFACSFVFAVKKILVSEPASLCSSGAP